MIWYVHGAPHTKLCFLCLLYQSINTLLLHHYFFPLQILQVHPAFPNQLSSPSSFHNISHPPLTLNSEHGETQKPPKKPQSSSASPPTSSPRASAALSATSPNTPTSPPSSPQPAASKKTSSNASLPPISGPSPPQALGSAPAA